MTPTSDELRHLDATAQADLVARGEISARELTDAAIARIDQLDPTLHALVSTRYERARAEADAIDRQRRDERGPFAGVPFVIKDLDALGGEPLTLGSRLFERYVPRKDDPWIGHLRSAGLVAVGKTATPEFGLVNTTEGALRPATRNPWGQGVSPGGSSGGSAVAIAAGMVPVASASDGGGSIRIPASACGIFGLKPSRGRGVMPPQNLPGDCAVTFAYGRSVRDTARLLEIADAARVVKARTAGPAAIGFVGPADVKPLRIGLVLPTLFGTSPEPEVEKTVRDAAALLEQLGHHVEETAYPIDGEVLMDHFLRIWASLPARLARAFWIVRAITNGWRFWTWPSYEESLERFTRELADFFRTEERANPGQLDRALAYQASAEATLASFFESFDLVLSPVLRKASFPHGEVDTSQSFEAIREAMLDNVGYTPMQNYLGLPAMSVPLGTSSQGLPVGVHVVGPFVGEARLLQLAYQLEEAAPWANRRPPS